MDSASSGLSRREDSFVRQINNCYPQSNFSEVSLSTSGGAYGSGNATNSVALSGRESINSA